MGQNSSSQRQSRAHDPSDLARTAQRYEELAEAGDSRQDRETLLGENDRNHRSLLHPPNISRHATTSGSRQPEYHSTYRRETRARSTHISAVNGPDEGDVHGRDDVVLEQEERPLILRDMEVRLNDAPITDIQAAPMPRRNSLFSRFGSRVTRRSLPRPRDMGVTVHDEELPASLPLPNAHMPLDLRENADGSRANRFSMFDFPTRSIRTPRQTSRSRRASLTIPPPFAEYSSDPEVAFSQDPIPVTPSDTAPQSQPALAQPGMSTRNQRARSFRQSVVAPISHIFHSSRTRRQQRDHVSSQRQVQTTEETANLISPQGTGPDTTTNERPSFNAHPGVAEEGSVENPVELDSPDRPTSWLPGPRARPRSGISRDRPTSLVSGPRERPASWMSDRRDRPHSWMSTSSESSRDGRRRGRRLSNLLGGRSSRLIRREDDTPLSRVLQLAAAAIAAQLSGTTDPSSNLQSVGDDHFDGNLNAFIQSLNTAAEASASADEDSSMSNLPPLNFWRVFRFINSSGPNAGQGFVGPEGTPSRLVTLVVVGVRSVPSSSLMADTAGALEPNLDGILALPPVTPDRSANNSSVDTELDTPSSSGFLRRNRTPSTGFSSLPSLSESQRSPGLLGTRLNRSTARNPLRRSSGLSSNAVNNRPPSPFPDSFGSRSVRETASGEGSPRTPSTPSTSSGDASTMGTSTGAAARRSEPGPSSIRQRPRSESHGHLGSGAARRNGVVEPDTVTSNGRHWLIYVVGTNLSEDHPAFQAPSLFTDNPSYEDMLMLSALLGPAKPPVASAQDVAIANGVYRLETRRMDGRWMARLMDRAPGSDGIPSPLVEMPAEIERCLVCLTDYEIGEEIRQLQNCNHVFHRECVDTWLTTGRNSCPLCRGNGVEEKSAPRPEDSSNAEATVA